MPTTSSNRLNPQNHSEHQPLNRLISFSDTNINYQANYKDIEEASGSSGLINLDGSLNLNMILKGLHSVILKENSLKLCELTLYILDNLTSIDIMPSEEIDSKLAHAKANLPLSESSHSFLDNLEVKYNENFYLATDVALRNIKWLGCINCQMNSKTFLNEQLRGKIKLLLSRLHNKNAKRFREFFKTFIKENDVNHIMETFHALLGYCYDPYGGYGHYHPYINVKNASSRGCGENHGLLYANNFGSNRQSPQEATVNIESVIVELILKPIVNRLIEMKEEIMNQENLYLFSDIRSLFGYIKENHGGIFRKVAFANMLEPLIKLKNKQNEKQAKLVKLDEKLAELEHLRLQLIQMSEPEKEQQQTGKAPTHLIKPIYDAHSTTGLENLIQNYESKTVKEVETTVVLSMTNLDAQKSMSRKSIILGDSESLTSSPFKKTVKNKDKFSQRGSNTFINGSKQNIGPNSSKYADLWPLRVSYALLELILVILG